jgi:hypothetical protein
MTTDTYRLDALAYEDGTFAMVAMDQRESLRTMLAEHGRPDGPGGDHRGSSAESAEVPSCPPASSSPPPTPAQDARTRVVASTKGRRGCFMACS